MLDELITEGRKIRKAIIYIPPRQGVWRTFRVYSFADNQKFEAWKNKCLRFLSNEFKEDRCIMDFDEVIEKMTKSNYPESLDKMIGLLEACVLFPRIESKKNTDIVHPTSNITINNSQNQTQSQEIAINIFLDAIKDELTGKQMKEIKEICEEDDNSPETKNKILDKLKSFGVDVLSNVVAGIITNPSIWSNF